MEKKKEFIINVVFYALILSLVWGACRYILPVMAPFIIAFIVAAILQVQVRKVCGNAEEKRKVFSIVLTGGFYILLFSAALMAGIKFFEEAGDFIKSAPALYRDNVVPLLEEVEECLETAAASVDAALAKNIESIFQNFTQNLGSYISDFSVNALKLLPEVIVQIPGFIIKLVVTVVATFFISIDYDRILEFFRKYMTSRQKAAVKTGKDYAINTILIFLKSYTILFLLTFVELSIGFWVLKLPYPALLGLGIAIFDILPVLGTGGILLPWAVVLFVIRNIPLAIGILLLYLIITIIRNVLEPKIVGKQIGLHPLATLIAMFLGLKLLGIIGMIVFPVGLTVLLNLEKNGSFHIFKRKS